MNKETKDDSERFKSAFLNLLEDQQSTINKLGESEKFNRLLFEKSPVGIAICRLDGTHLDANPAYLKILGFTFDEILTISVFDLTPPEFINSDMVQVAILQETGAFGPYIKEYIGKDGRRITAKTSGVLIEKDNEKIVLVNVEDITKQKEDEKNAYEREQLFKSLYENSYIGFYRTTPDGRILLANPALVKMLGYSNAEEFFDRNLEVSTYEPRYRREDFKEKLENLIEIKGWEDVWLKKDGTEIFIRESARIVKDANGEVAYYEGTVEDISDSKLAQRALRENEEIYSAVFSAINDAIFITNAESGYILTCNDHLSGYKAEELIGKSTKELKLWVNESDRENVVRLVFENGSVTDYVADFKRKDGTNFAGSISISPVHISGNRFLLSVIRDISQRKKDQELLKQSEEKFRAAFYISPDSININRLSDGVYVSINKGFTQLTGYTEEDVIGKSSLDINIWADPKDRARLVEGLRKEGSVSNLEAPFKLKDGTIAYALMSAAVLKLGGIDHIISLTRDISERKQAEQQQWNLREELHTTLYSIGDAVISTDNNGLVRQMNPIAEQLTGWQAGEALGRKLEEVFPIICEDDGSIVENPVARVLSEGVIVGLANHTVLISKDGQRRPIADSGAPIRNKDGKITGVVMVFRDQTEERKAQETLQRNEERMRAIVEGTPNLFFYTQDNEARTTYVSPTIEMITGYTIKQWLSAKDWFLTDSRMNENAKKLTHTHLMGDFSENTTVLEVRHAKGFPIVLEIFEYPIFKNGEVAGLQGVAHDVTRRYRVEEELQKTNATLNSIIKSSPLAIIAADLKGGITLWNLASESIFGWSEKETLGRNLKDIFIADLEEHNELWDKISSRSISNYEIKRRKKDGTVIDVSISSTILHDVEGKVSGVMSMFADITSRKRYEENLKKLYQATEQSPVSIIITDVKGNIEYANPQLCSISGYSFNEVIGKNPRIFKSGDKSIDDYKDMWNTLVSGNQWKGEFQNKKKDGSVYWESASISPMRNDYGIITHFIAVKEDITDKKKILEELIQAKTKAEDANKTKDVFLANMSHELRTPLIGILGYSDLLTELLTDQENIEMAKGIKRSGKRLLNTLNMILNFTKIEAEKYEIALQPLKISNELEAVYKMFYGAAVEKNLKFTLDIKEPDLTIDIDSTYFSIIMENLINNALKFTAAGSIKIIAEKSKNDTAVIKVKDTGIGIDKKHFNTIFQEFRQVSEGINRDFQGTGLGLSIAKKYIEMMNGTIKVESKMGQGTVFTVNFPLSKDN